MTAIEVENLSKTFRNRKALDGVSLSVRPGEMVALIGASGSGKSTLIRHIAGLVVGDRDSGNVSADGCLIQTKGRIAANVRRSRACVGVVFQQFNLVGRLSVMTNVLCGALGRMSAWRGAMGLFSSADRGIALDALRRVGIHEQAPQRASTLSGGQQQRAAIARALVQKARVILADEPIASLDPESAKRVMDTLSQVNRNDGITVLVSLHQVDYAIRYCPRTVALRNGAVVFDGASARLTPDLLRELYGADSEELFAPVHAASAPSREGALAAAFAGA